MSNAEMTALHWVDAEGRWKEVQWGEFLAFRGLGQPHAPLPGVAGGVHHFVVVVMDQGRVPVNIIQHKYLVELDGSIGADNFTGWTREERDDYAKLMTVAAYGPGDDERLNEIRAKGGGAWDIPKNSVLALVRGLPDLPAPGSAAELFLKAGLRAWGTD